MRSSTEIETALLDARSTVAALEDELKRAWLAEADVQLKPGDIVQKKGGKKEKAVVREIVARGATWIVVKGSKLKKDGTPSKTVVRLGSVNDLIVVEG